MSYAFYDSDTNQYLLRFTSDTNSFEWGYDDEEVYSATDHLIESLDNVDEPDMGGQAGIWLIYDPLRQAHDNGSGVYIVPIVGDVKDYAPTEPYRFDHSAAQRLF